MKSVFYFAAFCNPESLMRTPSRRTVLVAIPVVLLVLFVLMIGGLTAMFGGEQEQQGGFSMAIEAEAAKSETFVDVVKTVGTLVANEGIILRPEVSGRVSEITFEEGQKVEKGQVLVRLDQSVYQAQVAQAEAQLSLAKQTISRASALAGRGAGTRQALDEATSSLNVANAALQLAKANLDKTALTAPFSGTVGIRHISLGDYVSPGQDVVSLQDLSSMKVDFNLPETLLARLAPQQAIKITVSSYPGEVFTGEVTAIDPLVSTSGRSIAVRALIPNPEGRLRPGLFAEVKLVLAERPNTVFVPAGAIWPVGNDSFVFKITNDMAALAPVKIAARQGDNVYLSEGLNAGDMVVTAGQVKLTMGPPGQPVPVAITNAPPAPTAAAPVATPSAEAGK